MIESPQAWCSPWPHRWAVVLACATFPLVWVGGLVTTTDAGMAVPDWPSTYGYNLFLYPWQSWLAGPWDLFVEHGHRLLGAAVGMLTIGLMVALWRTDDRRWVRQLGIVALVLVVFQGVLGGMRVLLDERTLAMLHGCTGPLFFALAVALVVFTSRTWRGGATGSASACPNGQKEHWQSQWHTSIRPTALVRTLAVVTATLVYLQLLLGAVVRHVPVAAEPTVFVAAVKFHLAMAAVLTFHVAWLLWAVMRSSASVRPLALLAWVLGGLMIVQLLLGAGTWIVKYSVPVWAREWLPAGGFTIEAEGWLQTHVVTAHVAVGSLLLATSVALALYALRLLPSPTATRATATRTAEVAL
jgi:cytochrome c oxidase assembly protein subunit 15